jgi:ATP-dependent Clp protease ATP-binding subunit ClpA
MKNMPAPTTIRDGAPSIFTVRGKRVILDSDLATLYGVPTKRLNEQVRRNAERFPRDFAFLLASDEWEALRSQIATLKGGRGAHRKFLPYVFTEHGVLMAAGVLNSKRAIEVSIHVVRTLVAMREELANTEELGKRLDELERSLEKRLRGQDHAISELLQAIKSLMNPPPGKNRPIGFVRPADED